MAIAIKTPPEPLSPKSFTGTAPALIGSDASRLLTQELLRYCSGNINGRSFLIAGHRGAGKTTLAASAYVTVLTKSGEKPQEILRPLFVPLHGPNLLPDPDRAAAVSKAAPTSEPPTDQKPAEPPKAAPADAKTAAADAAGSKPKDGAPSTAAAAASPRDLARDETDPETQAALVQITLALHRAVCKEFAEHYRARLVDRSRNIPRERALAALELSAELELELYQWPTASRLREFWSRAGVLERGVLQWGAPDQGLQELVALSAVCDAYRRISGTWSQTEKATEQGSRDSSLTIGTDSSKALFAPLISVLTGGLVGSGLSLAGAATNAAAFGAAASALAASLSLQGSVTRKRTRSRSREDSVLFDLSVATLDRMLPVLIAALLRCGLAPMFVVDELDKVKDLETRMIGMVHHLKKFVAERAFFCFLTDRLYFEQLLQRNTKVAFPSEYTYFTHRVFVVFRPDEIRKYLLDHIFVPPPAPPVAQAPAGGSAAPPPPGTTAPSDDALDYLFLPWVILHRSRMHPIDVQREVAKLSDADDKVALTPGTIRAQDAFRFDAIVQMAIEIVLSGETFQTELSRDPVLQRVAHDAMYYVSRLWEQGKQIDLGSDGDGSAFYTYLDDRVGVDGTSAETSAAASTKKEPPTIPLPQKQLLYAQVRELARLLANPKLMARRFEASNESRRKARLDPLPAAVFQNLRLPDLDPPLLNETHAESWSFEWGWDIAGNRRLPRKQGVDRTASWNEDIETIAATDRALKRLLGRTTGLGALANEFGVLPASYMWSQVETAITRLRDEDQYPERDTHRQAVAEYATMLDRNVVTLGRALMCAAAIGWATRSADVAAQLREGLRVMAAAFGLPFLLEQQLTTVLEQLWNDLNHDSRLTTFDPPQRLTAVIDVANSTVKLPIAQIMQKASAPTRDDAVAAAIPAAWESAAARTVFFTAVPPPVRVVAGAELICAVARTGTAKHIAFELHTMTVSAWSNVFASSLEDVADGPDTVPTWFAPLALAMLGFGGGAVPFSRIVQAPSIDPVWFKSRKVAAGPEQYALPQLGVPFESVTLLVKARRQSPVDSLPRSRPAPALALTLDQLMADPQTKYLNEFAKNFDHNFIGRLVIEMPTDVKRVEQQFPPSPEQRRFYLYASPPPPDAPAPFIIAPTSWDTILST